MDVDWIKNQKKEGIVKGGLYLVVYMRRVDFLYVYFDVVLLLDNVVKQIKEIFKKEKLEMVFFAIDVDKEGDFVIIVN